MQYEAASGDRALEIGVRRDFGGKRDFSKARAIDAVADFRRFSGLGYAAGYDVVQRHAARFRMEREDRLASYAHVPLSFSCMPIVLQIRSVMSRM